MNTNKIIGKPKKATPSCINIAIIKHRFVKIMYMLDFLIEKYSAIIKNKVIIISFLTHMLCSMGPPKKKVKGKRIIGNPFFKNEYMKKNNRVTQEKRDKDNIAK